MRKAATGHRLATAGIAGDTRSEGFPVSSVHSVAGECSWNFHRDTPAQNGLSDRKLIHGTIPFREFCFAAGT